MKTVCEYDADGSNPEIILCKKITNSDLSD